MPPTNYTQTTHVYATRQTLDLHLDVYIPTTLPQTPKPVLLWFHGGYLVPSLPHPIPNPNSQYPHPLISLPNQITGSRKALPPWLLAFATTHQWPIISADYRVIPESTAHDTLSDTIAAYEWTSRSLPALHPECRADAAKIILAGASAGGWCALTTALHFTNLNLNPNPTNIKKPLALFLLYPITSPGTPKWATPLAMPDSTLTPAAAARVMAEISSSLTNNEVSVGEDFPTSEEEMRTRKRLPWVDTIFAEGLFLDYVTGREGFTRLVVEMGLEGAV
ncbi:alpha/beta-hydrolase, partial [Aspergillus ellipticus CBS 707.79]